MKDAIKILSESFCEEVMKGAVEGVLLRGVHHKKIDSKQLRRLIRDESRSGIVEVIETCIKEDERGGLPRFQETQEHARQEIEKAVERVIEAYFDALEYLGGVA